MTPEQKELKIIVLGVEISSLSARAEACGKYIYNDNMVVESSVLNHQIKALKKELKELEEGA